MAQASTDDSQRIQRHDFAAPRYTSYPTAAQFNPRIGAAEHRQSALKRQPGPLSIYVHIPFCASPCFYCGCTRIITRRQDVAENYLEHLHREIVLQARLFDARTAIAQLHLGGGTPTFLDDTQLEKLLNALKQNFHLLDGTALEQSIEVDPRTIDPQRIERLAAMGFNRLSLGIQDFDPAVQQAVNRVQTIAATRALIDAARRSGFSSVSVDLIYGLPFQNLDSFSETLDQVIAERPDRVAAYSYAHMPHLFVAQKQIRLEDLPSASTKFALLQLTIRKLTEAGYVRIGMDHFSLPGDSLAIAARNHQLHRNFQGYSTHADHDLLGLGLSAISHLGDVLSQNAKTLESYQRILDSGNLPVVQGVHLSGADKIRGRIIEDIMCGRAISVAHVEHLGGINFKEHFSESLHRLEPMADDGLIEISDDTLRVTPDGISLLRNIASAFDEYLPVTRDHGKPRHSRTI